MSSLRSIAMLSAALPLIGCALTPPAAPDAIVAPADTDQQAKRFAPPAGKSAIYIYRQSAFRGGGRIAVSIDGRELGTLPQGNYFAIDVEPGEHEVWVGGYFTTTLLPGEHPIVAVQIPVVSATDAVQFVRASKDDKNHQVVTNDVGKQELLACCVLMQPKESDSRLFR